MIMFTTSPYHLNYSMFTRFTVLPLYRFTAMEAELATLRAQLAAEHTAEAQLHAIAQQQQILLGTTPQMTWFKDVDGRYVFCSASFLDFLKLRHDQVIGRTAAEIFPADYAVDLEANDRKAQQTGAAITIAGYVRNGQSLCWIETQKTPVYDAQGRLLGVLGTSIDVSARHTSQELLARHARCAEGLVRCSQGLLRDRTQATPATDVALAETIAGTLASALTNMRLLATEQRQRRLAESLR